jgi:hypothetical protein
MSGGGGTNTVTNSGPPEWAIPYYQSYYGKAAATADLPYTPYTDQRTADINPYQQAGLQATANRALQGSQEVGQARTQLGNTLGGGYMNYQTPQNQNAGAYNSAAQIQNPYFGSNPYLQSQIDQASGDVVRNYQTAVKPSIDSANARSGSFGNSGLQEVERNAQSDLQRNLGNISSGMRFQDYTTQQGLGENAVNRLFQAGGQQAGNLFSSGENLANRQDTGYQNERARQLQGIGLAPQLAGQDYVDAAALSGVGDTLNKRNQGLLDTQYQNFLEAQNYPYKQLGTLGGAFGVNAGNTSSTQGPSGSPVAGALGGAAAGASLAPMLSIAGPYGALAGAALGGLGSK